MLRIGRRMVSKGSVRKTCAALRVATVDNDPMVCMLPNEALTDAGYHALLSYDKVHPYAVMRAARAWCTQHSRSERHDVAKTTTTR